MNIYLQKQRISLPYRILSAFVAFTFIFSVITPPRTASAQIVPATVLNLPVPGTMVPVTDSFTPPLIKGITIHPENSLEFDFIVGTGDTDLKGDAFKEEARKLIKYFLAALTVPEEEMWVNLSPYEKDRIIPNGLGDTEMGRDLLAQDYILKQLTASLMYPEDELGQKFWDRVYKKAYEQFGTTEIPMNTFNKIWIVPEEAVVYEKDASAFVVKSRLKVMLEEDYVALQKNAGVEKYGLDSVTEDDSKIISNVSSEVVREVLIPEIEKEVNEGKTFAKLRQIYNSMILATWYKKSLKDSLLGQVYVDQNKTKGIDIQDKQINQKIYDQYVASFKKGVYNYIREDYDPATQEIIPRKYFSGGISISSPVKKFAFAMMVTVISGVLPVSFDTQAIVFGDTQEVKIILAEEGVESKLTSDDLREMEKEILSNKKSKKDDLRRILREESDIKTDEGYEVEKIKKINKYKSPSMLHFISFAVLFFLGVYAISLTYRDFVSREALETLGNVIKDIVKDQPKITFDWFADWSLYDRDDFATAFNKVKRKERKVKNADRTEFVKQLINRLRKDPEINPIDFAKNYLEMAPFLPDHDKTPKESGSSSISQEQHSAASPVNLEDVIQRGSAIDKSSGNADMDTLKTFLWELEELRKSVIEQRKTLSDKAVLSESIRHNQRIDKILKHLRQTQERIVRKISKGLNNVGIEIIADYSEKMQGGQLVKAIFSRDSLGDKIGLSRRKKKKTFNIKDFSEEQQKLIRMLQEERQFSGPDAVAYIIYGGLNPKDTRFVRATMKLGSNLMDALRELKEKKESQDDNLTKAKDAFLNMELPDRVHDRDTDISEKSRSTSSSAVAKTVESIEEYGGININPEQSVSSPLSSAKKMARNVIFKTFLALGVITGLPGDIVKKKISTHSNPMTQNLQLGWKEIEKAQKFYKYYWMIPGKKERVDEIIGDELTEILEGDEGDIDYLLLHIYIAGMEKFEDIFNLLTDLAGGKEKVLASLKKDPLDFTSIISHLHSLDMDLEKFKSHSIAIRDFVTKDKFEENFNAYWFLEFVRGFYQGKFSSIHNIDVEEVNLNESLGILSKAVEKDVVLYSLLDEKANISDTVQTLLRIPTYFGSDNFQKYFDELVFLFTEDAVIAQYKKDIESIMHFMKVISRMGGLERFRVVYYEAEMLFGFDIIQEAFGNPIWFSNSLWNIQEMGLDQFNEFIDFMDLRRVAAGVILGGNLQFTLSSMYSFSEAINTVEEMGVKEFKKYAKYIGEDVTRRLFTKNLYAFGNIFSHIHAIGREKFEKLVVLRGGKDEFIRDLDRYPGDVDKMLHHIRFYIKESDLEAIVREVKEENPFLLDVEGIFNKQYSKKIQRILDNLPSSMKTILDSPKREKDLRKYLLAVLARYQQTFSLLTQEDYKKLIGKILLYARFERGWASKTRLTDNRFYVDTDLAENISTEDFIKFLSYKIIHNFLPYGVEEVVDKFVAETSFFAVYQSRNQKKNMKRKKRELEGSIEEGIKMYSYIVGADIEAKAQLLWIIEAFQKNGYPLDWGKMFEASVDVGEEKYNFKFRSFVIGFMAKYLQVTKGANILPEQIELFLPPKGEDDMLMPEEIDSILKHYVNKIKTKEGSSPLENIPGGINLNPDLLDLQIKRDGNGVPLPVEMQPIENMHIDGFIPIIINVTPVNLPVLLGLAQPGTGQADQNEDAGDISYDYSRDPLEFKERFTVREFEEV